MKAYKKYMDRIRVDDEQHAKLLKAVRAAEEKQASGAADAPQSARLRRFPLKRLALIASAAAVIVLAVGVIPGIRERRTETRTENTASLVTENPVQPGADVQEANVRNENRAEVTAQTAASEQPAYRFTITKLMEPEEQNGDPVSYQNASYTATFTADAAALPNQTAAPAKIDESREGAAPQTQAAAPEDPAFAVFTFVMKMKDCLETAAGTPAAGIGPYTPDFSFMFNDDQYDYDSTKGIFRTGDRAYALNESERLTFNKLLDGYFSDK